MTSVAPGRLAAGTWTVDPPRTTATFAVRHLGLIMVHGSIGVRGGELDVDESGAPIRICAELDLHTIDTGNARRDADLHKPRFLDIERHPTMIYAADRFRSEADTWAAEGELQLRGTSCPLVLTGVVGGGDLHTRASARMDRTAVGLHTPRVLVGKTVTISIEAGLTPPAERQAPSNG